MARAGAVISVCCARPRGEAYARRHGGRREWTDTAAEYGMRYSLPVQTIVDRGNKQAESELSAGASLSRRSIPSRLPLPAGLQARAAPTSIELTWERNTEPDLAGYRVYRATAGGAFESVGRCLRDARLFRPGRGTRQDLPVRGHGAGPGAGNRECRVSAAAEQSWCQ